MSIATQTPDGFVEVKEAGRTADGKRLYEIPGFNPMRWPELLALLDKQSDEAREANYDRTHPYGQGL